MDHRLSILSNYDLHTNAPQDHEIMQTTRQISVPRTASAGKAPRVAMVTMMLVKALWYARTTSAYLIAVVEVVVVEVEAAVMYQDGSIP